MNEKKWESPVIEALDVEGTQYEIPVGTTPDEFEYKCEPLFES